MKGQPDTIFTKKMWRASTFIRPVCFTLTKRQEITDERLWCADSSGRSPPLTLTTQAITSDHVKPLQGVSHPRGGILG